MLLLLLLSGDPYILGLVFAGLALLLFLGISLFLWGVRILSRKANPTRAKGLLLIAAAVLLTVGGYYWLMR